MTALLPRYLNIRRGSYICAIVGLVMCPWHLLSSSNNFTTYLSAYSVFLSSIAGVMISDYYFVRRGYLQTRDLYSAQRTGPYWYTLGIHWRGYAAYICGILIKVVGFAGAVGTKVPIGATYSMLQPDSVVMQLLTNAQYTTSTSSLVSSSLRSSTGCFASSRQSQLPATCGMRWTKMLPAETTAWYMVLTVTIRSMHSLTRMSRACRRWSEGDL